MKKVFILISVFILAILFSGCNKKIASGKDYVIGKEIEVIKELTIDETLQELKNQKNRYTKQLSCTMITGSEDMLIHMDMQLAVKKNEIIGTAAVKIISIAGYADARVYIKDNYILYDFGNYGGKLKAEIPTDDILIYDSFLEYDIIDMLQEVLSDIGVEPEKLKTGYDQAGCLIFDYNLDEQFRSRIVFDDGYPIYLYMIGEDIARVELSFDYSEVSIEIPENLNIDDYKTVPFDDIM